MNTDYENLQHPLSLSTLGAKLPGLYMEDELSKLKGVNKALKIQNSFLLQHPSLQQKRIEKLEQLLAIAKEELNDLLQQSIR